MIKNVNLMQNPQDIIWDKESEYSREHLVQALANLGQRIGIKGDGISYKSFTFNDILDKTYSASQYVGFIEYFKDSESNDLKAKFGVTDKYNIYNSNSEQIIEISQNINNAFIFPSDLSFSLPVNNIEKYTKNSICINSNGEFTMILVGKIIGSNDNDNNNAVLMYYKFDINSNKLICAYKTYYVDTLLNESNLYCLEVIKNERYENNELSNSYTFEIKLFNSNEAFGNNSALKKSFEKSYSFNNYNSVQTPFSILNVEYIDIDKLLYYSSDYNLNYDSNSIISVILNNEINNIRYAEINKIKIELDFNSAKNELLSVESNSYENLIDNILNEYSFNISEDLYMFNEDINKLYINLFKYYNEKIYLELKSTFIKRILLKIYEASSEYNYESNYRMYVPLDYNFHYICNSNNDLNIYYSNNIYVTYTSLKQVDLESFWNLNTNIIYDYDSIDKIKVYNFEVTYNSLDETLINSIDIKDIYTMPYINANNNWSINNIDTKISAIGKDAGNPNIIIIFSKDKNNNYNVLNAVSNKNIIESSNFAQKWITLNTALFENVNEVEIKCCAYIPEITDLTYNYFKNSIIFNISTLDCLEFDNFKENYKGSYIYSLWHIAEKNGVLSFELINDENNEYALTLGSTVNLINENSDSSVSNLNDLDLILLKSIISNVAQEHLSVNKNNWLIIKNKQSEEYANEYSTSTSNYENDLNAIMQYSDNVTLKSNHIIYDQKSKYIDNISQLQITNALYPKYNSITKNVIEQESTILGVREYLKSVPLKTSKILVNGSEVTNVELLTEELRTIDSIEELKVKYNINVEEVKDTNLRYNEYIFNSNVPTLDFKELFIRNTNILNRLNLISLDQIGNIYNAYIGTSFNETNKSTLHIGSTNTNINIGSTTLINESDRSKFNTHDTISIDFNNIVLNAASKVVSSKPIINEYKNGNYTYYIGTQKLIGNVKKYFGLDNWTNINELFVLYNDIYYVSINKLLETLFNFTNLSTYDIEYISVNNVLVKNNPSNVLKNTYTELNSTYNIYLYKLNGTAFELEDNTIYSPLNAEVMYYTYQISKNNQLYDAIKIYITLK